MPYQPRRIGLRREKLGYTLLQSGPHVKTKSREQTHRSPSIDIDAPPKDSSDEASTAHEVDLSDTESLPSKKMRIGTYKVAFESTGSKSPHGGSNDGVSELANERSRISSSTFSSSNGRPGRRGGFPTKFQKPSHAVKAVVVVDVEDPIDTWSTKHKKNKALYGTNPRNIHTALSPREEEKKDADKASVTPVGKSKTGFRTLNNTAVEPLR